MEPDLSVDSSDTAMLTVKDVCVFIPDEALAKCVQCYKSAVT